MLFRSRASGTRATARNAFWQLQVQQSRDQVATLRKLQAALQNENAELKTDLVDAKQEQDGIAAMTADLSEAAKRKPLLNSGVTVLNGLKKQSEDIAKSAEDRETSVANLQKQLPDLIAAAEARQASVEAAQKAAASEGAHWNTYYSARIARAQTECAITGQAVRTNGLPPPVTRSAETKPDTDTVAAPKPATAKKSAAPRRAPAAKKKEQ